MARSLRDVLLDLTGIRSTELIWLVGFATRRKTEGEVVEQTKFQGVLEDKYVWEIKPRGLMNTGQIRFSTIYDEINDVHIPLLEEDESSKQVSVIKGTYRRERIRRFGKQISDRVIVENKIEYNGGGVARYENR